MIPTKLEQSLNSPDPEVRRVAVSELAHLGAESSARLMHALGDPDWRVRKEATQVIIGLPHSKELATAVAQAFLPNDNVGLRNAAVEALAALGQWAIEALESITAQLDADGRKLVAEALGQSGQPSAVRALKPLAVDDDQNVRVAALEALGHVGASRTSEIMPLLTFSLLAKQPLERLSALQAINELGIALEWNRLSNMVGDVVLQRAVLTAASLMSDGHSAQLLAHSIDGCRESDFPWAVVALAGRINHDASSLPSIRKTLSQLNPVRRTWLMQLLGSDTLEYRQAALLVLASYGGSEAVQAAFDVLDDDSLAATAEHALGLLHDEALSFLREKAMTADSPRTQALAIDMLTRLDHPSANGTTLEAIAHALNSEHPAVLRAAFEFLERESDEVCLKRAFERFAFACQHVESPATLALQAMARRHPACARQLISGANVMGSDALAAVVTMATFIANSGAELAINTEFLSRAMAHESPHVRRVALEAMVACGHASASDMALFALTDEEPQVRRAAVRAMGRASDPNALDRLVDIVHASEDTDLVVSAICALGESDNARVLAVLRPVARGGAPVAAVAAVEAIGRLSDARRINALIDSLSHADAEVVKAALQMLANEADLRASGHLGACLDHEAWDVRRLAADLLGRIGGESVTALLRTKLAMETEPLVRDAILRALGDVDPVSYTRRNTPCFDVGSWRPK